MRGGVDVAAAGAAAACAAAWAGAAGSAGAAADDDDADDDAGGRGGRVPGGCTPFTSSLKMDWLLSSSWTAKVWEHFFFLANLDFLKAPFSAARLCEISARENWKWSG